MNPSALVPLLTSATPAHNASQKIPVFLRVTMPTQPGPKEASVECHVSRVRGDAASAGMPCLRAHLDIF